MNFKDKFFKIIIGVFLLPLFCSGQCIIQKGLTEIITDKPFNISSESHLSFLI